MTKKIFLGIALLAALVSCNKEQLNNAPAVPEGGKALVIGASLDPLTKMDYTPQDDGSYKVTFLKNGNDALYAYFVKASATGATVLGAPVKLAIDLNTISADKRSANFVAASAVIPEEATHVYTFFANGGTAITYADSITVNIANQNGVVDACKQHVIYGVTPVTNIKKEDSQYSITSVALGYETSLVKFVLTLPDGSTIKKGATPYVELEGAGVHNEAIIFSKAGITKNVGKITLQCDEITEDTNVVTASGIIIASDNFAGSKLMVWDGDVSYAGDFAPTATLAGGKAYTAARQLKPGPFNINKWVADAAGSMDWNTTGVVPSVDWLSFADGKLNWTENTTGKARTGTAKDAEGNLYEIYQIGPAEFAGNWTVASDIRTPATLGTPVQAEADVAPTGSGNPQGYGAGTAGKTKGNWYDDEWPSASANNITMPGITFVFTETNDTNFITDLKTAAPNNITIKGMYENLEMPARVEFNYEAKTVKFYFFVENKTYANQAGTEYLAFATELRNAGSGEYWQTGFGNGGAMYYSCDVTIDGDNITAKWSGKQTCPAYTTYNSVGVFVNRYMGDSASGANLVRSIKSIYAYNQPKAGGTAYARVFQGAITFTKVVE